MRKLLWVVWAVGWLAGCKKESPTAPEPEPVAREEARAEAGEPEEAPEEPDEARPYVLTQAKLDAYVTYQRKVMESYAVMGRELQAARAKLAEGGSQAQSAAEAMKSVESKAELESRARKEAGLNEEDINRLGNLVMDVITQRHMAAVLDLPGELKKLEAMQARLKPEQAAELAPQIHALRERVQETERLVSVRKTHGDANVDLVLTREAELMANYQDMLRSFGGKSQ